MAAAAAAGLGSLGLVEAYHVLVRLVDQAVCKPGAVLLALAELGAHEKAAVLGAGVDVHVALIALVDPLERVRLLTADGTGEDGQPLVGEGLGLGFEAVEHVVADGVGPIVFHGGLIVRHAHGEDVGRLVIHAKALRHVETGGDDGGIIRIAECVVGNPGLLDLKMLHGAGKGLLVLVTAGLEIVDELEVDPARDPIPVEIVDDDVLLHDALIVAAPCDEGHVIPTPGAKLLHRVGEGVSVAQALLVKAGDLFDLVVHAAKVHGLYVNGKLLAGLHVLGKLDRADLNDLAAEMDRQLIKYGGFGTHRLIPFQIHHHVIHSNYPLTVIVLNKLDYYNISFLCMHYFFKTNSFALPG